MSSILNPEEPNELEIHDMSGNVWEWCRDNWANELPADGTPLTSGGNSSYRALRGGAWTTILVFALPPIATTAIQTLGATTTASELCCLFCLVREDSYSLHFLPFSFSLFILFS